MYVHSPDSHVSHGQKTLQMHGMGKLQRGVTLILCSDYWSGSWTTFSNAIDPAVPGGWDCQLYRNSIQAIWAWQVGLGFGYRMVGRVSWTGQVGRVGFWLSYGWHGQYCPGYYIILNHCCLVYNIMVTKGVTAAAVVVQWSCVWVLKPMVQGSNTAVPFYRSFCLASFSDKFLCFSAGSIALAKVVRLPDQQPLR